MSLEARMSAAEDSYRMLLAVSEANHECSSAGPGEGFTAERQRHYDS